jgi:hypothetical protein
VLIASAQKRLGAYAHRPLSFPSQLECGSFVPQLHSFGAHTGVDVSYAVPQAHGIVNVTLHCEFSPGIIFIFSQGRKDLYHV